MCGLQPRVAATIIKLKGSTSICQSGEAVGNSINSLPLLLSLTDCCNNPKPLQYIHSSNLADTFIRLPSPSPFIHHLYPFLLPKYSIITGKRVSVSPLSRFEEQHRNLAKVEIDEMFGLVGNVAAKVAPNDAVPRRVVLLVELLLDIGGNILWGGTSRDEEMLCEMVRIEIPFEKRRGTHAIRPT